MAEHFFREQAAARGLAIELSSCGLLFDGEPSPDKVVEVMAEHGIDVQAHRSRKFTPSMLESVDVVVTMERMQARELAVTSEGASTRVHTLGSLCAWLNESDDLVGSPADRIAAFAATRRPGDLLGSGADEIADPHGRSKRLHRKTAERLEVLGAELLDGLFRLD